MSYTMYTPLNVWLDPASVTDVVAYIQNYLSENTIYSEEEIEELIHDYLEAHPELIGGVQSVNGKTGTVVLSASDINTQNNVTIESVLASLSSQISSIASSVATNTSNITNLTGRVTTAETDISNLKSNIYDFADNGYMPFDATFVHGSISAISTEDVISANTQTNRAYNQSPIIKDGTFNCAVQSGFRCYVWRKQSNSVWTGDGWKTGTFVAYAKYGVVFVVARITETSGEFIDIATLKNALKFQCNLVSNIEQRSSYVNVSNTDFELGAITISQYGWEYYYSDKRVRTKQGNTIHLKRGYVISLSNYADARFYVGWLNKFGVYNMNGWNYSDFVVPEDGEYVILIMNHTDQKQSSVDALFSLLSIRKETYNTDVALKTRGGVISVAHGATTYYPPNTLMWYKQAYINHNCYWECDVRPCLDGYVLCHDNDIYNHALASDGSVIEQNTVLISESTLSQLQSYKFGVITDQQNRGLGPGFENETIPTLKEFLMLAKAYNAVPFIEIKFSPTQSDMQNIVEIIKECGLLDKTYVLCYDAVSVVAPLACQNGVKNIALIVNNGSGSTSDIEMAYGYVSEYKDSLHDILYCFGIGSLSQNSVNFAASKGMRSLVFTLPENAQNSSIVSLFNNGASAMITNLKNVSEIIFEEYE